MIMYTLVYYVKRMEGEKVYENVYPGEEFRLKKNALRFMREITKECYIENGYTVEDVKNGLNCYKSDKTDEGNRKIIEILIKVEK